MKKSLLIALALAALSFRAQAVGSHYIHGYTTKRGTYVAPHHATNPDHTKPNNWSHKGNINPYTAKFGSRK